MTAHQPERYEIRRFARSDRDAIQNIRKRAFESVYASWRELLGEAIFEIEYGDADQRQAEYLELVCQEDSGKEVYVLICSCRVIGFIGVSIEEDRRIGEIDLNAVDPDFQGHGAGTHLYTFAVARLRERGVSLAKVGTGKLSRRRAKIKGEDKREQEECGGPQVATRPRSCFRRCLTARWPRLPRFGKMPTPRFAYR